MTKKQRDRLLELADTEKVKKICDFDYLKKSYGSLSVGGDDSEGFFLLLGACCAAKENAVDRAVISFLRSVDYTEELKQLARDVFYPIAFEQKKKSDLKAAVDDEVKQRKKENRKAEKEQRRADYEAFLATRESYYNEKLTQDVVEAILKKFELNVRLNLATKQIEVFGRASDAFFELHSRDNSLSTLPTKILDECKENNVGKGRIGLEQIKNYIFSIADANRYNPIQDMLRDYCNQDESSLETLYDILGVTYKFDRLLIKKWLIQTVAFAFSTTEEPVSSEGVLVLQGAQGNGKTSFFRKLAGDPQWFTEGAVIDMRNKDTLITATSCWICELGEIDCTLKKEQSALKAFITRPVDKIRLPYAAAESIMPRTTSMCGTVNPEQFLKDSTGNRRYWTVHVDNIDKRRLHSLEREEVFRLWGYIYHLYQQDKNGFRLSDTESRKLEVNNRDFSTYLPYEEEVRAELDFCLPTAVWSWISPAELALYIPRSPSAEQVGKVLSRIEKEEAFIKKRRRSVSFEYFIPLRSEVTGLMKRSQAVKRCV